MRGTNLTAPDTVFVEKESKKTLEYLFWCHCNTSRYSLRVEGAQKRSRA